MKSARRPGRCTSGHRGTKGTAGLSVGGSVSVIAARLSAFVVGKAAGSFTAEVSAETAARSTLSQILAGTRVNLDERFALAWSLPLISVDELALHL